MRKNQLYTTDDLRDRSYVKTGKGKMMYGLGNKYAGEVIVNNAEVRAKNNIGCLAKLLTLPERLLGRWRGTAIYAGAGALIMAAGILLTPVFGVSAGNPWRSMTVMLGFALLTNSLGIAVGSPEKPWLRVLCNVFRAWLTYEAFVLILLSVLLFFVTIPGFSEDIPIWDSLINLWREMMERYQSIFDSEFQAVTAKYFSMFI